VQQLAVGYVGRGYHFYVVGWVPDGKDPRAVDEKLILKYGITPSKAKRARRKAAGLANVQLLRYQRFFVLLATAGKHHFFEEERPNVRDARRVPIKFGPYSVSYKAGHPHVRIAREEFLNVSALLQSIALRRSADELENEVNQLPYEPYAPVKRQLFQLLRKVNNMRNAAGLPPLSQSCLRLQRKSVRPFDFP
jgi:hypothetical protein